MRFTTILSAALCCVSVFALPASPVATETPAPAVRPGESCRHVWTCPSDPNDLQVTRPFGWDAFKSWDLTAHCAPGQPCEASRVAEDPDYGKKAALSLNYRLFPTAGDDGLRVECEYVFMVFSDYLNPGHPDKLKEICHKA